MEEGSATLAGGKILSFRGFELVCASGVDADRGDDFALGAT